MSQSLHSSFCPQDFSIDRSAAIAQLTALGYVEDEIVYLRAIPAPGYSGGAINLEAKFPALPWAKLEDYQKKGKGIYVVVNGGGHANKKVTQGRAIFCEFKSIWKLAEKDNNPTNSSIDCQATFSVSTLAKYCSIAALTKSGTVQFFSSAKDLSFSFVSGYTTALICSVKGLSLPKSFLYLVPKSGFPPGLPLPLPIKNTPTQI
jgi:hypothetical protein